MFNVLSLAYNQSTTKFIISPSSLDCITEKMAFIDRTQNLADMKSRIVSFMKIRGPCLPIHISKETKTSLLLASAFLSDLSSEKTIKISNMKVGGSPLYFLPGQESMLENFQNFLKGKEREALLKIKQTQILRDDELEPAIRIAIRAIKDFAKPYSIKIQDSNYLFWQYFSLGEDDARRLISDSLEQLKPKIPQKEEIKPEPEITKENIEERKLESEITKEAEQVVQEAKQEIRVEPEATEKKLEPIFHEKPELKEKRKPLKDRFLEELRASLSSKSLDLIKFEKIDKKEIIARIKQNDQELLLFAFDKKRISEAEILKAYKKAAGLNLPYSILLRDELSKKQKEILEAYKNLEKIERF